MWGSSALVLNFITLPILSDVVEERNMPDVTFRILGKGSVIQLSSKSAWLSLQLDSKISKSSPMT